MRGVDAFDVEGGVGFRVAEFLRLFQHGGEIEALVAHLGQNEIGGAVDDAGDPFDAVGRQAFAQRLDDGDAAGDGRLEGHHHALVLGGGEDFVAVYGQQCLVGRDHVLPVGNGLHDQGFRQVVAADQFDDDVDLGIVDDQIRVIDDPARAGDERFGARYVAHGDGDDFNAAARAALDFFLVALQDAERAVTDVAQAQQADLDGFHSYA